MSPETAPRKKGRLSRPLPECHAASARPNLSTPRDEPDGSEPCQHQRIAFGFGNRRAPESDNEVIVVAVDRKRVVEADHEVVQTALRVRHEGTASRGQRTQ